MVPLLTMDHIAEKFNVNKIDRSGGMTAMTISSSMSVKPDVFL